MELTREEIVSSVLKDLQSGPYRMASGDGGSPIGRDAEGKNWELECYCGRYSLVYLKHCTCYHGRSIHLTPDEVKKFKAVEKEVRKRSMYINCSSCNASVYSSGATCKHCNNCKYCSKEGGH